MDGKAEGKGHDKIETVTADELKAREAAGRASDAALDVGGSETSTSTYRQALTGGDIGVGRGNATTGSGVHGNPPTVRWDFSARPAGAPADGKPVATQSWFGNLFVWAAHRLFENTRGDFDEEATQPDALALGARMNPFADPVSGHEATVLDQMMGALGLTADSYVYRASRPQWIQNGRIGLNRDSVAMIHDPYSNPDLLPDIKRAYEDLDAAEALFESMWDNGQKASGLEFPGLNVGTDAVGIVERYGGPGSERVLIRMRLSDFEGVRVYPDVGGGAGDKSILYVTGENRSVPVEIYDSATGEWVRPENRANDERKGVFADLLSVDAVRAEPYDIAAARREGLTALPVGELNLWLKEGADIEAMQDAVLHSMPEGMSLLVPESELGYIISTEAKLVFGVPGSPDLRFVVNIRSYPNIMVAP